MNLVKQKEIFTTTNVVGETMSFMYSPSIIEVDSKELGQKLYESIKYGFRDNQHIRIEYNTDTSAGHPTKEDDDIVRYSQETWRVQDKELEHNI